MMRSWYKGVDPIIVDLVETVEKLQQKITDLEAQVIITRSPTKNGGNAIRLDRWKGVDYVRLFHRLYQDRYGLPYPLEYRSQSYPGSLISNFMVGNDINPSVFYSYVFYLFDEDAWALSGVRPDLKRLWNIRMFKLYLKRLSDRTSKQKQAEPSTAISKVKMSPETEKWLHEIGRNL